MLVTLQPENLMSEFSFLYSDNFFKTYIKGKDKIDE